MDDINVRINQQSSIGSDSNGEDISTGDSTSLPLDKRICLIGSLANDSETCTAAQSFGVHVVTSDTGEEYAKDKSCTTIFVIENFEGSLYNMLYTSKQPLLGPPALKQLANKKEILPDNTRPLFNLAMSGVVLCFTGFRNKDELTKLVPLVHHMGASIRKEMSIKVTHLIANVCGGEKYQYAAMFRVPAMNAQWVHASWERKEDINFSATQDTFVTEYKLKPFHGARVCFVGFPEEEEKHMVEVLKSNGGTATTLEDATCTHVVMEQGEIYTLEAASASLSSKHSSTHALTSPKATHYPFIELTASNNTSNSCTPYSKTIVNSTFLDTLQENTIDDSVIDLNNTNFNITLNDSSSSMKRKRKLISPDKKTHGKRIRDISYSENRRRKFSDFFKTPINYFSNRRRTIDASSLNYSKNESILSMSGVFDVENLNESKQLTPSVSDICSKSVKKSLFTRTFSSAKFNRTKLKKKIDLNATKLSFDDNKSEFDATEKLNGSCFSTFSIQPMPNTESWPHSECTLDTPGPLPHAAVVDESSVAERPDCPSKAYVVKAEWFWTSVQKEISLLEKDYLFDDYIEQVFSPNTRRDSHQATPSSASRRKRKRLHETLQSLSHQQSPGLHKRRSSVSDAGLLSVSGSFLDCTTSPEKGLLDGVDTISVVDTPRKGLTARQQVFLELVQTESNYVNILHTIVTMFKKHLEEMNEEEALLNNTELKIIFGNLPPIYDTHVKMLDELRKASAQWSEDRSIGNIILKYSTDLLKSYPPFINFFEEMKEMLIQCDTNKPRFHAFLKACQTRPECGRQGLQDLLIRPVQRLGSISLLLNDILKSTPKTNPDHSALGQALAALREVMTHINEDKRKTEGQRVLFDIFNDIDNCPPDIVSSHRSFVAKCEVIQISSSEGLSSKGNVLALFLFSDHLEVCKKRSKAFNTLKSPNTANGLHQKASTKPYKHIKLMPLNTIKRVIDIKETEECQKVFSLVCRNNEESKERLYSFAMAYDETDKMDFLKTLTKQMANNSCTADADKFLAYLEPHQLDINTSDVNNGTLSKAFKFATRTRLKVGRAFSFNKTPSKLKRAVSSMMSPFGSSTNLTPASQLAQMRLASYNNINELGNATNAPDSPPPVAPMSVQPTRKIKSSSLGVNVLKRL